MNGNQPPLDSSAFGHIALQTPDATDHRLEIAGLGARSHAFAIDWHIRFLLALTWLLALGFALHSLEQLRKVFDHELSSLDTWVWLVPAAAIYFLYHPVLEVAMVGRTPGKRMAGVRLVTTQGHTPGTGALLLRNVFRLLDSLPGFYIVGLVTVAVTRQQVRIGDLAAGLVLVYDDSAQLNDLRRAAGVSLTSGLAPDDQAVVLELTARWTELDESARIRFAEQLLGRLGRSLPVVVHQRNYGLQLKTVLEGLLNPSDGGVR
ncbi:MAG: RDD family protein [Methylococcaceae bacterium]|nr:RDD family protein [Methylococcaceae bacterium]